MVRITQPQLFTSTVHAVTDHASIPVSTDTVGAHASRHIDAGADELASPLDSAAIPATLADKLVASASNTLQHSNDTEKSAASESMVKLKEMNLAADLQACRVKFDLKSSGALEIVEAKIYKNGVAVGTLRYTGSSTYVTYSEDFTNWVKGNLIQIYARALSEDSPVFVANMRIYYDLVATKAAPTNQDPT
jgi:hypothetical protein